MRLEKITDVAGNILEVNLDSAGVLTKNDYNDFQIVFGGYFVNVDEAEYKRIKSLLEPQNVLCEVSQTEDPIKKFKEIVYRATYLDSNAKLQLIMQLENIE